jgi:hypothetical protein
MAVKVDSRSRPKRVDTASVVSTKARALHQHPQRLPRARRQFAVGDALDEGLRRLHGAGQQQVVVGVARRQLPDAGQQRKNE